MTDNNDHITTEELIHAYVSDRLKDNATDGIAASELLRLQQHAERDIYKDIRNEILRDITEDEKKKKLKEIRASAKNNRSDAMAESKSRLLHILKYLWQNTDAGHYTTTADILTYLKTDILSSCEDRMKIWQTFLFVI